MAESVLRFNEVKASVLRELKSFEDDKALGDRAFKMHFAPKEEKKKTAKAATKVAKTTKKEPQLDDYSDASVEAALKSKAREEESERNAAAKARKRKMEQMRATTSWKIPKDIPRDPELNIACGEDSRELHRIAGIVARKKAAVYKDRKEVPDSPAEAPKEKANEDEMLEIPIQLAVEPAQQQPQHQPAPPPPQPQQCSTNIHHRLQCTSSKDRQCTPNLHKLACNSHPLLLQKPRQRNAKPSRMKKILQTKKNPSRRR